MKFHVHLIVRNILLMMSFLISPYIGLIFSLYFFFNSSLKTQNIFWVAFFFGLMGLVYDTFDEGKDIYRYYEFYDAVFVRKTWDFNLEGLNDGSLILLFLGLGYLGLIKNYIGAISAFVLYYLLYYLLYRWIKIVDISNRKNALITGCLLLFFTTTLFSYTGLRFVTATLVYMLAVLSMYKNEKWKAFICSLLVVLIHFSLLPLVVLLWIYHYIPLRHFFLIFFICLIIGFFIGPFITYITQLNVLPNALQSKLIAYIVEQESTKEIAIWYGSSFWIYQKIYCTLFLLPFLLWKYAGSYSLNCGNFNFSKFIGVFYCFLGICFSYPILLSRYSTVLVYFSVLYLVYILGKLKNDKSFLYFQIVMVCFIGIIGIFISGNEEYKILLNQKLLLFPFKLLMNG